MLALSDLITEVERQGMSRNPIAYRGRRRHDPRPGTSRTTGMTASTARPVGMQACATQGPHRLPARRPSRAVDLSVSGRVTEQRVWHFVIEFGVRFDRSSRGQCAPMRRYCHLGWPQLPWRFAELVTAALTAHGR
jgi:hypothetical protein